MRYLTLVILTLIPFLGWSQIQADKYVNLLAIDRELIFEPIGESFNYLTEEYDLSVNEENYRKFMDVQIIHRLINESPDAPDIWNFQEPNERHRITLSAGTPLITLEHEHYNSYADIDRTPYSYLDDLFSDNKYYHPDYNSFATFGWCAEREMAYSTIMHSLGYTVEVIAPGSHAWSRISVHFRRDNGNTVYMQALVDNTYDIISWNMYEGPNMHNRLERWYNQQVRRSKAVLGKINVSPDRSREILQLFKY